MSVSDNIKQLRRIFNVTQKQLADIAGVTENAVSKWENGYSEPRMGAIERNGSLLRNKQNEHHRRWRNGLN